MKSDLLYSSISFYRRFREGLSRATDGYKGVVSNILEIEHYV